MQMSTTFTAASGFWPGSQEFSERVAKIMHDYGDERCGVLYAHLVQTGAFRGRRVNSVVGKVWTALLSMRYYWLPTTLVVGGVVISGTVLLAILGRAAINKLSLKTAHPVQYKEPGKRLRYFDMQHPMVPLLFRGEYPAAEDQEYDHVCLGDVSYSKRLVGELKLASYFRVRDYPLLLSLTVKAQQWVKSLPQSYEVPEHERHRLVPGSVAVAMLVDLDEQQATALMRLSNPYGRTRDWGSGVPRMFNWRDVLMGRVGLGDALLRRVTDWVGSYHSVGPKRA
jgi:hypothetical protein